MKYYTYALLKNVQTNKNDNSRTNIIVQRYCVTNLKKKNVSRSILLEHPSLFPRPPAYVARPPASIVSARGDESVCV